MVSRRGLGKGKGKGYKNIIPKDPKVHSMSRMGIKQPQRIRTIRLSDFKPELNVYKVGDITRISIEESLYEQGQRIDGLFGKIKKIEKRVATVLLDDGRIITIPVALLTAKQLVVQSKEKDTDGDGVPDHKDCDPNDPTKQDEEELKESDLSEFTGSMEYHRWNPFFRNIVATDGAKYMAEKGQAYWLLDAIASWQTNKKVRTEPFQVWTLKVDKKKHEAILSAEDGNGNKIATQKIPYTDFPLEKIKIFYADNVILLPSEY